MKNNFIRTIAGLFMVLIWATGCKKESESTPFKAVFSYSVSGNSVTFQNFTDFRNYSAPYATYKWDFGDGDTSDNTNSFHKYRKSGSYLVTLTAVKGNLTSTFSDSVSVAGGTNITIDGDFTDWEDVDFNYENKSGQSSLLGVKVVAFGDKIFIYLEGTSDMNVNAMDMYFNTDGDSSTGYQMTDDYPKGSGAEYLFEGQLGDWGSFSQMNGTSDNFDDFVELFDMDDVDDPGIVFSDIVELPNGHLAIEMSFTKKLLGGLKKKLSFAIIDTDPGWNPQGELPVSGNDDSAFIEVDF